MSGNSLEDVKKIIKSLVLAQQNGLSSISLNSEFIEVEGRPIPWKSFGANCLTDFLRTLTDIIVVGSNKAGEQVFFPRVDSSTAHIANLVSQQRPSTVKRRNNMVRNDDKRPCREPNGIIVPPFPSFPSSPSPTPPPPQPSSPPERTRSRRPGTSSGTSDRRRDHDRVERSERRRQPSPMSISPPRRSPTPEPDRFRNPSPPRHGRSHSSFRDSSPDRPRRPIRDVSPSNLPSSSTDYDKELQRARERRGLPAQSSRSRRSRTRSPSPRRHRHRPSPPPPSPPPPRRRSPPRIQSKSASCQTDLDKVIAKKLVSVSCQTEAPITEKPVKAQAQTSQADGGDDPEQDLNAAYYGVSSIGIPYNINNPYNAASIAPVYDPSFDPDENQPGFYYDYDAGSAKPIPLIPEYYAAWIFCGMMPKTGSQQQPPVNQYSPYPNVPHHQPPSAPPSVVQPTPSIPLIPHVNSAPPEVPMKKIPVTPTKSVTRDPRLARQAAAAALAQTNTLNNNNNNNNNVNNNIAKANDKQSTIAPNTGTAKRKALSINDYMKTRKLGPDKSQHIANGETLDTMNNSPDQHGKWGITTKRG